MNRDVALKRYNKKMDYTFSLGTFPTIELLRRRPKQVLKVLLHSQLYHDEQYAIIQGLCEQQGIPVEHSDRAVERIRDKDKCLVIGVFQKYSREPRADRNHIVLVNPGDMGNLGTIIRTGVGMGFQDLAVISPGADIYHPKVVRASMGSLFHLNFKYYESIEAYRESYAGHHLYPFMLKGAIELSELKRGPKQNYSLVFGNESSGLPDAYAQLGTSVLIRHNQMIDSLNLSMAAGIAMYEFARKDDDHESKEI